MSMAHQHFQFARPLFRSILCKNLIKKSVLQESPHDPLSSSSSGSAPMPFSDNDLAHRAKTDMGAFSELFERFFTPLYRYFYVRLRHHEDAEDLTSETFEKLFTKLHTFQERGVPFTAWMFTIAHHCLVDHVRRSKGTVVSIDELDPSQEPHDAFSLHDIDQKLLTEKLWKAIAELPERSQQIWALKLSAGMAHKDIAHVLGLSESNVNVILHRSFPMIKDRVLRSAS